MEVAAWLRALGLECYEQAFRENAIDAEILRELTEADLEKIGVLLGDRKRLLRSMASLKREPPGPDRAEAPGAARGPRCAERRHLTVMFADLVGSTALSVRLDPEDMREVIRSYQNAVAGEVARFEGYPAKFMGDGVLAYFGWPRAQEDAAERAVRAGLAVARAVAELSPPIGPPLAARVGIASGLVVVGDLVGEGAAQEEAVVGDTPNLAARLQAAAHPGTVLIGDSTRRLLGALFELDPAPAGVKGFSEPLHAFRVRGEGLAESRFEAFHAAGVTPLVGREHELGLLLDRWERARDSEGQVVLLTGEPGIGKSRLVQAVRERLAGESYLPLSHYCSPFHQTSALHPVIGLLDRAAGFARDDPPARKLDKLEVLLAQAVPEVGKAAPLVADLLSIPAGDRYPPLNLSPGRLKERTFEVLIEQLVGLAARQPVLWLFEDAHWADPTTLELIDLVIDRVRTLPVLSVITFRPELTPRWTGHPHVTSLTLSRLGRRQGAVMVERLAGDKPLPAEVLEQIVARTDGVPLFVEELTKSVLESGLLVPQEGGYALCGPLPPLAIPATLHDSLRARLDRLASVREVVQVAACIGREFGHELLAAVSGLPETELAAHLDRLGAAELVFRCGTGEGTTYRFKHALVHEAAYQSLLRSRRRELHGTIARVIEERFPELASTQPEILAHHYAEAALARPAVLLLQRAGQRAVERSAYAEATSHLTRGLELLVGLPEGQDRAGLELELQLSLGAALMAARGYAAPEVEGAYLRAGELSRVVGQTPKLFAALHGLYRFYHVRGDLEISRELGERLLDLARDTADSGNRAEAHRALGVSLLWLGDVVAAKDQLEQGIACYDAERDRAHAHLYGIDPAVVCLSYASLAWWYLGYPERALDRSRRALALAERLGHPHSQALALVWAAWLRQLRREPDGARRLAEQAVRLCDEQQFPLWQAMAEVLRGWAEVESGRVQQGIVQLAQGLEALRATGAGLWQPSFLGLYGDALARGGRVAEGLEAVDQAIGAARGRKEAFCEPELLRVKGELLWRADADETVVGACLRSALEQARRQESRSLELRSASGLARLWVDLGRGTEARELLLPVLGWFSEGLDTADLREAKALLELLA